MTPLFMLIGLITWFIVLLLVWHDYEDGTNISDITEVVMIGGVLGGILAVLWPVTWTATAMILLTRGIYKVYQVVANELDEQRIKKERHENS